MKEKILSYLPGDYPWQDRLHCYESLSSTNTLAKKLVEEGCPTGTVVIASAQTAGRGRMGRQFASPEGCGLYLSFVLRHQGQVPMHLTCAAGVAAVQAVEKVCRIRPSIKWINDLCWEKRKLGGILTEGCPQGENPYFVVGIGINCRTPEGGYPPEIASVAASLSDVCGRDISPAVLAAALLQELQKMTETLFSEKEEIMTAYKENCITLGKDIQVIGGDTVRCAKAVDLSEDGALVVEYPDGSRQAVQSGEVSVRGMYGYL